MVALNTNIYSIRYIYSVKAANIIWQAISHSVPFEAIWSHQYVLSARRYRFQLITSVVFIFCETPPNVEVQSSRLEICSASFISRLFIVNGTRDGRRKARRTLHRHLYTTTCSVRPIYNFEYKIYLVTSTLLSYIN